VVEREDHEEGYQLGCEMRSEGDNDCCVSVLHEVGDILKEEMRYQKNIRKISEKYQKNIRKISEKYQKNIKINNVKKRT
jgi:hypothetical protein